MNKRDESAGHLIVSVTILFCTMCIDFMMRDCFHVAHPIQTVALGTALVYAAFSLGQYLAYRRMDRP